MTPEMSPSTLRAVDLHDKVIKEGTRRIESYELTKFDKIQFKRACSEDQSKVLEFSKELSQKIFGPDFLSQLIQIQYSIIKELSKVNLQQFALYTQKTLPEFLEMHAKLDSKCYQLVESCLDDEY